MKKPYALIQVDCDREWENINVSVRILSIIKRIFERYHIKSTFFVVGNDLQDKGYRKIIQELVEDGYEIANHTTSHLKNFTTLNYSLKQKEIYQCHNLIKDLGYNPYGFRTPHFGLDKDIVKILGELGYIYDSSIIPTSAYNYINKIKSYINKEDIYIKSPCPKDMWRTIKASSLYEVPITVMPLLKIPFHASYAMTLPRVISYLCSRILINNKNNTNNVLTYVFHLNDLCPGTYLKSKEFRLFQKLEERIKFFEWICREIAQSYSPITTIEYVQKEKNTKYNKKNIEC